MDKKKAIVLSCTLVATLAISFVATIWFEAWRAAPNNVVQSVRIAQTVTTNWSVGEVHGDLPLVSRAPIEDPEAARKFESHRSLGKILRVLKVEQTSYGKSTTSRVSEIATTAEVELIAEFERGSATVGVSLRSEGEVMKLWDLSISALVTASR